MKRGLIALILLAGSLAFGQSCNTPDCGNVPKSITGNWTDSTSAGVTYNMYEVALASGSCSSGTTGFTLVGSAASGATTATDPTKRALGSIYCVVVTSLNSAGIESVISNVASVDLTLPAAPTNVTATAH